jgi:hypothetical protein
MLLGHVKSASDCGTRSVTSMLLDLLPYVPWCLLALAVIVAVIRADPKDLPAIVRALMRMGPRDDDSGKGPPSLPKP